MDLKDKNDFNNSITTIQIKMNGIKSGEYVISNDATEGEIRETILYARKEFQNTYIKKSRLKKENIKEIAMLVVIAFIEFLIMLWNLSKYILLFVLILITVSAVSTSIIALFEN